MPRAHPITGIRGLTSKTYFNQPPVEWGRADGAVATIALGSATGDNGTSGAGSAVDAAATSTDGGGSGLKVDLAVASDVVTAITVDAAAANDGDGYRIGDKITITAANASTATDVVGYVTSLEYEN
tara:strand:- start:345 stop:722 length:378 start_codon:yes stop_codon:yes gene_type:complete